MIPVAPFFSFWTLCASAVALTLDLPERFEGVVNGLGAIGFMSTLLTVVLVIATPLFMIGLAVKREWRSYLPAAAVSAVSFFSAIMSARAPIQALRSIR